MIMLTYRQHANWRASLIQWFDVQRNARLTFHTRDAVYSTLWSGRGICWIVR